MKRIAIFPGSFDPITIGHESIVRRAVPLFDEIHIMVGDNISKTSLFPIEKRVQFIEKVFANEKTVSTHRHAGLTIDFCKKVNAGFIIRGLRTSADFEYERAIAQVNKMMMPGIETVFLLTLPEHTAINSTLVRDIMKHGGDASMFTPTGIKREEYNISQD
ncbi:MAG: pantetheine-phosphate adenylyltransferase [Bacteroidales bacterium]